MITGTTSSGFSFSVPDGLKKDYHFIHAYKALNSKNPDKQVDGAAELVSSVFCNEEEEQRFLRHVEEKNGRATVDAVYTELGEIIRACLEDAEAKKS